MLDTEPFGYRAAAWAEGPGPVYDRLAAAVVAEGPDPWGLRALDIGAGTGAASRALLTAGAGVVAVDVAVGMLAHHRERRPPAAAADARALPFSDAAFDVSVAAFSLTHVDPPVEGMAEAARVTRPGGWVVASAFAAGDRHPVKMAVDEVMTAHGWVPPPWYARVKNEVEPQMADAEQAAALGHAVGLRDIEARVVAVASGLADAGSAVRYRLGMAQFADFLDSLSPDERRQVQDEATASAAGCPPLSEIAVLVLSGRT